MEAIFELLFAIIIQPILWAIQLVAFLLGLVIEFTLTAIFHGVKEASSSVATKLKSRHEIQRRREHHQVLGSSSSFTSWSVLVGFLVFIGFVVYQIIDFRIQRHRVEITRSQIASVADDLVPQELPKDRQRKNPRVLNDRDAWGTPLELFVNDFMLVNLIVVRSNGRDRRPGTIDDQLAVRWQEVAKAKILGKAIEFADQPFRKWLMKLLEVENEHNLPRQIDLK
jgi:hypothetical protein